MSRVKSAAERFSFALILGPGRLASFVGVAALGVACGRAETSAPSYQASELTEGIVARVGTRPITGSEVGKVMAAQRLGPRAAVEAAVRDELLAREAQERLSGPILDQIARSTLARALVESLAKQARTTPPTEEEVRRWTERKWYELDHPRAAQTVHAVVRTPPQASAVQLAKARAVAQRIEEAVRDAKSPEEFKQLAEAVPHEHAKVTVQDLGAVTADGRVVSPGWPPATYDTDFSRAANALESPGDISSIVQSPFGFHVIYLAGWLPEVRVPYAKRLGALRADIYAERGKASFDRLLEERRRVVKVVVERSSEELMQRVGVDE